MSNYEAREFKVIDGSPKGVFLMSYTKKGLGRMFSIQATVDNTIYIKPNGKQYAGTLLSMFKNGFKKRTMIKDSKA